MRDRSAKWRRRSITAPPQPHVKPPPRAAMGPDPLRSPPAERERGSAALSPASGVGDQLPELIESFFIESFFIESCFIESRFMESCFIDSCDMALLELAAIALWAKAAWAARPQVMATSSSVARRAFMGSP